MSEQNNHQRRSTMSVVRVRTPISMGGETLSLKVKNHYTVWGLKVMINEFVPIYPHKLGLYLPGDNNELPVRRGATRTRVRLMATSSHTAM